MVERTFPEGLHVPMTGDGAQACLSIVDRNGSGGVTWVHSYVTNDKKKTYCIYDGPSETAIREVAEKNGLPVDSVVPVSVLDPYFYHDTKEGD
jgi:8-oxo-dGTP pyrophosphatase MutT (NUDIX family)